ncbi:Polyketide cyclase/dehydrase and lipid transport superfamily protein [Perilla frutescens var. frutescens]|nr:Polyketide cyclase/dehydrase and lipid transport superfamily protein [Perilla frutescens var. frutescens]
MALVSAFLEILQKPTIGDMLPELIAFTTPIWAAVVVGVLVGWAWKPKWANLNVGFLDSAAANGGETKKSAVALSQFVASIPSLSSLKRHFALEAENPSASSIPCFDYSSSKLETEKTSIVNEDDLKHLHNLAEEKDGGPVWIQMMDRSTPNMSYQAWRRDPETGPPQYRSRTIYEDATPEMLRDFFWDDEFRVKWDDMLIHAQTLEEYPTTGTMVVQWVRKFPFFCSDREYIIGRRIWQSGGTYYCITKGVPSSVPRRNKPRRVDLYYSSWCIRAAESKRDGRMTACEVLLFHHEDMGIPWEIAKLGVRQGMWGAVKKIDPGLRAYQKHRSSGAPLSPSATMAQINAKVDVESLEAQERPSSTSEAETLVSSSTDKPSRRGFPRAVVIGGALALVCTLDRGLLTKAVIFGVARKFARTGQRL